MQQQESVLPEPVTPNQDQEGHPRSKRARRALPALQLSDLPEDLLRTALTSLCTPADLIVAGEVWPAQQQMLEKKWHELYIDEHGLAPLTVAAAEAAGSWRKLFKSKTLKLREARAAAPPGELPWDEPCQYELQVALANLVACAPAGGYGPGMCVMFLLDGSGSVTEDDFRTMTGFVSTTVAAVAAAHPGAQAGLLQFSNDVRVELPPRPLEPSAFHAHLATMSRMNGGTNIALAIQRAGQLLREADAAAAESAAQLAEIVGAPAAAATDPDCVQDMDVEEGEAASAVPPPPPPLPPVTSRVLVLLTDGRVDAYQAREAVAITERLADEQTGVSMHAFGVGRGVDKTELLHIVGACPGAADPETRYLGLRTIDETLW